MFEQAYPHGEARRGCGDAVPRARPPQRPEPGPAFFPGDAGGGRSRSALLLWVRGRPEEPAVVRRQTHERSENKIWRGRLSVMCQCSSTCGLFSVVN